MAEVKVLGHIYNNILKGIKLGKSLIALQGSARSGKTRNTMIFLILCCQKRPNLHVSVVRASLPALKRSVYRDDFVEVMTQMGQFELNRMNKTEMTYTFPNGSIMEFFATNGPEGAQKVRGPGRDILFCNEANEIEEENFKQLRMRTRMFSIIDFNPSFTEEHWIYRILNDERTFYFKSTFADNIFLPDPIKEEILSYKTTNPALWRIFGEGEFAIIEGLVFDKNSWDTCKLEDIPIDIKESRIGIDFGYSTDPTAAVRVWTKTIHGERHMWVHQLLYDRGLKTKQIAARMKPWNDIPKFCENADPRLIDELEDEGMTMMYKTKKYPGSLIVGIQKMQGYHIHITKQSTELMKEMRNYCFQKDRHDNYLNVPIDKFNHCFIGSTPVLTEKGEKRIDSIEVGEKVMTSAGLRKVTKVFDNGIKKVLHVRLHVGDTYKDLVATPDHKIKTTKGWKNVKNLKAGDVIYLAKSSMGKSITYIKESGTFQEETRGCMSMYGNTTTAKSQAGTTSTIKTETHTTMTSAISKCLMSIRTFLSTCRNCCKMKNTCNEQEQTWPRRVSQQKNGTQVQRGENGIVSTGKKSLLTFNLKNLLANVAAGLSWRNQMEQTVSAQTVASQNGGEMQGLIMNNESASAVGKGLSLTSIKRGDIAQSAGKYTALYMLNKLRQDADFEEVKISQVELLLVADMQVYDIEVSDKHEFFACDVLVHNCIDALRYAVTDDRLTPGGKKVFYTKDELGLDF